MDDKDFVKVCHRGVEFMVNRFGDVKTYKHSIGKWSISNHYFNHDKYPVVSAYNQQTKHNVSVGVHMAFIYWWRRHSFQILTVFQKLITKISTEVIILLKILNGVRIEIIYCIQGKPIGIRLCMAKQIRTMGIESYLNTTSGTRMWQRLNRADRWGKMDGRRNAHCCV